MENILVCGASGGIGRACATDLAAPGKRLFVLARSRDKLLSLEKELKGVCEVHPLVMNLNETENLKKTLNFVVAEYGPITVLVANSGGPAPGPLLESKAESFIEAFQGHLLASLELVKILVPGMKEKNFGRIIHIISTSVKQPIPNLGVSNTIRGAMASFTKTLANELGAYGITVNNVLPGYTDTERLSSLMEKASEKKGLTSEELRAQWEDAVPMKRFARPEEIAHVVSFLASKKASYVNGVNLAVDGGRTGSL